MYREFFARSPMLTLPLAALILFIVVFTLIVVTTMRRRPERFESRARLPLEADEGVQS